MSPSAAYCTGPATTMLTDQVIDVACVVLDHDHALM